MTGTSAARDLSPERRARLLDEIARRRARGATTAIPRRAPGSAPVLSLSQERLWLLDQMAPGRATYNATITLRLDGPLHAGAMRDAMDAIVARHEALRTVIARGDDGSPQASALDPAVGCPWEEIRLPGDDPARLQDELRSRATQPFDLSADVLVRCTLFRHDDEHAVLLFVTHHIACDGWSRTVLFDELVELYDATVQGRPAALADLPIQYADYAQWQRRAMQGGGVERTLQFWRDELVGAELLLDLPTDRPHTGGTDSTGGRLAFGDDELGEQIRALGRSAAATVFMTYLALTSTVLHALTGQTDFLLGSPSANRDRPETTGLIGFFVDTIVIRVPLTGDPTFLELIERARAGVLRSLANPIPLERLVEAIRPKRVPGRNPLFQVNYRMQGGPPPPPALTGLGATRMFTDVGASRFDLAFGFVDEPGPLRGYLEYDSALFDEATVRAWADTVVAVARVAVSEPHRTLSELAAFVRADLERSRAALPVTPPVRPTGTPGIRRRTRSTGSTP